MTSLLQLLLVVVIVFLTLLLGFVAFQTVTLIHEYRQTLKRINQELDGDQPSRPTPHFKPTKPINPIIRRFFRKSGLPLRAS